MRGCAREVVGFAIEIQLRRRVRCVFHRDDALVHVLARRLRLLAVHEMHVALDAPSLRRVRIALRQPRRERAFVDSTKFTSFSDWNATAEYLSFERLRSLGFVLRTRSSLHCIGNQNRLRTLTNFCRHFT